MNAREIVRTALVIGGIWIGVSTLSSLASSMIQFVDFYSSLDGGLSRFGWELALPIGLSVFFTLAFGVAPALYLIYRSGTWAAALTPSNGGVAALESSLLLATGLLILGVSLVVDGAGSLLSGLLVFFSLTFTGLEWPALAPSIGGLLSATFRLAAGIFIYRWGSRSVLHAA